MFRGINAVTVDAKGRLAVPTRYRESLCASIVITIDPEDSCLLLYQTPEWLKIEEKLQNLPSFNTVARKMQRLLIGHATEMELDSAGRLLVPPQLRKYAQLEKAALLVGQSNKFEIWDEALWHQRREEWLVGEGSPLDGLPELSTFSL